MVERLAGAVRRYDWGCPRTIPTILGDRADGTPWAEYWLGAHPTAPGLVGAAGTPLGVAVTRDPGWSKGPWPHLFKILAARTPLSLQVHPDERTAARSWARQGGVPGAYVDPHGKPEMLVALRHTRALAGWAGPGRASAVARVCRTRPGTAAGLAVRLLRDPQQRDRAAVALARALDAGTLPPALADIADDLAAVRDAHRGDSGLVVAALLDRHVLEPGEALYVPPGVLHAYLSGVGVEVMSASDNVFRAGLTTKPVDVAAVLAVTDTSGSVRPLRLRPEEVDLTTGCVRWSPPGVPWRLARRVVASGSRLDLGSSVLFCEQGRVEVRDSAGSVVLNAGQAAAARRDAVGRSASGSGVLWQLSSS